MRNLVLLMMAILLVNVSYGADKSPDDTLMGNSNAKSEVGKSIENKKCIYGDQGNRYSEDEEVSGSPSVDDTRAKGKAV